MTRLKNACTFIALIGVAYLFVTRLGGCLAHADTGAPPLDDASIVARHGFWAGALMVFGIASKLLARSEAQHWLKERRWLAIVAGGVAVIAAGLNWKLNGGDPEALTLALSAALGLVLSPNVTSSDGGRG